MPNVESNITKKHHKNTLTYTSINTSILYKQDTHFRGRGNGYLLFLY